MNDPVSYKNPFIPGGRITGFQGIDPPQECDGGGGETDIPDATQTVKGIVALATTEEAVTGTDNSRAMTPLATKAVINTALSWGGF